MKKMKTILALLVGVSVMAGIGSIAYAQSSSVVGEEKNSQTVESLIADLKDEDFGVRYRAIRKLGELKDPQAVEPLIDTLNDEYSSIRWRAARTLKEITGEDFGEDPEEWQKWWEKNKTKFGYGLSSSGRVELPPQIVNPEPIKVYQEPIKVYQEPIKYEPLIKYEAVPEAIKVEPIQPKIVPIQPKIVPIQPEVKFKPITEWKAVQQVPQAIELPVKELPKATIKPKEKSTITFENRSGEPALVKVKGPTRREVKVPNGESRNVNVSGGQYFIKIRYGDNPNRYRCSKGEWFDVVETTQTYSSTHITLHPVVDGNYETSPIPEEEFNRD